MAASVSGFSSAKTLLSIVIPMYNEETCAGRTVAAVQEAFRSLIPFVEIVAVDDGSTDSTRNTLNEAATRHDGLRVVSHDTNRGKAQAVQSGIRRSSGRYIAFLDADLQYHPRELRRMLQHAQTEPCDAVTGIRDSECYRTERLVISRVYNRLMKTFFGVRVTDCNAGIKILRRAAALNPDLLKYGLPLMVPFLHTHGYSIDAFPVALSDREAGASKFYSEDRAFGGVKTIVTILEGLRGFLSLLLDLPLRRVGRANPTL